LSARANLSIPPVTTRTSSTPHIDLMARITTVYIRAYAVGEVRVATYVGCRPTSEGNPSVHLSDAKNPEAINYFNYSFSIPFQEQLQTLCCQMGSVFGLGFYIHDFLPCRQTGRLFVSESGFKLGPGPAVKEKYWHMRSQIPPFSGFFSAEHVCCEPVTHLSMVLRGEGS
jgi:hypothetical protein